MKRLDEKKMQIAANVEQNFMYTGAAYDLGRGERSNPVEGIPQWTPGPGAYAQDEQLKTDGNLLR